MKNSAMLEKTSSSCSQGCFLFVQGSVLPWCSLSQQFPHLNQGTNLPMIVHKKWHSQCMGEKFLYFLQWITKGVNGWILLWCS